MATKVDLKKKHERLYSPSAREVSVVDIPRMNFLMIDGQGDWRDIYRLGGVADLITVLVALLDIVLSFLPGERDVEPGCLSATNWFARFQESRFLALRDLGLLNIVNTTLAIPVYLALYGAHRRASQALAAFAAALTFVGAAVYTANTGTTSGFSSGPALLFWVLWAGEAEGVNNPRGRQYPSAAPCCLRRHQEVLLYEPARAIANRVGDN